MVQEVSFVIVDFICSDVYNDTQLLNQKVWRMRKL